MFHPTIPGYPKARFPGVVVFSEIYQGKQVVQNPRKDGHQNHKKKRPNIFIKWLAPWLDLQDKLQVRDTFALLRRVIMNSPVPNPWNTMLRIQKRGTCGKSKRCSSPSLARKPTPKSEAKRQLSRCLKKLLNNCRNYMHTTKTLRYQ